VSLFYGLEASLNCNWETL